ncbi:hypothetical protein V6Z12_A08G130900 [Gossypium hirsutum]
MATKTESTKKLKAETIQPKNGVRFLLRQRCQRQWPHTITVVQFQRNPPPKQALTTLSSAFSLGDSISAAATSVGVDGPTASTNPSRSLPFRVGHGFGLHLLEPGYPLIIGGIDIPHSDGDVLLHCVVYAILGALGLPDIGQIVPNSDPKRKGAASSVFIKEAGRLMHEAGYEIGNLDANLILQRPKLSPHKEAIKSNLSQLLGADPSVVNLKVRLMKMSTA